MVVGTLALDGWVVVFHIATKRGAIRRCCSSLYQVFYFLFSTYFMNTLSHLMRVTVQCHIVMQRSLSASAPRQPPCTPVLSPYRDTLHIKAGTSSSLNRTR